MKEPRNYRVMFPVTTKNRDTLDQAFAAWKALPEVQAKINALVELESLSQSDKAGIAFLGEDHSQAVQELLTAKCAPGKFVGRESLAAHIASIVNPSTDIDSQTVSRKECLDWIDSNTDNENTDALFVSKKGKGGGISLRAAL